MAARKDGGKAPREAVEVKGESPREKGPLKGMNVVMFITDQERAIQHFPPGWAEENLPGMTRLQKHGVTFTRAFTNSCMCSPARSTLMTGLFPAQHGVKYTLEEDMPDDQFAQVELSTEFQNVAGVMKAAGYHAVWKGKWHLAKKADPGGEWRQIDVHKYGFDRWNPPDAGANQDIPEEGGGIYDNDGRFMNSEGPAPSGNEGALEYLRSHAAKQQPFFLVISLVNPHDVLFYPANTTPAGYEDPAWFQGDIEIPGSAFEDLSTKPNVQAEFLKMFNASGALTDERMMREYLNFYGNLMRASDEYLVQVLDTLDEHGLMDDTLVIRTSDHGEMGLAHGGLRQKNFNFYEEALRVPMIYSNRRLFPEPRQTDALVSHVDFLPTLASLFGAPGEARRAEWQGVDYSRLVLHPDARPAQRYTVFTWDDWQAGQNNGVYLPPPNHIISLREERWKLARYYDANGNVPDQWEMYDLLTDPDEIVNLAWRGYERTPEQEREFRRLKRRLSVIQKTRLHPLPNTPESPVTQQPLIGSGKIAKAAGTASGSS